MTTFQGHAKNAKYEKRLCVCVCVCVCVRARAQVSLLQ
jgi:hypothetical protein